jgi:hypothetical protein
MLSGLTVILRHQPPGNLASALNAFEFSAMLAVLGGVTLVGLLPQTLPWNRVFLLGCVPMLLGLSLLRSVLARLPPTEPAQPWFARTAPSPPPIGVTTSGAWPWRSPPAERWR